MEMWIFSLIESLFRVDDGVLFKINTIHLLVVLSVELKSRLSMSGLIYTMLEFNQFRQLVIYAYYSY